MHVTERPHAAATHVYRIPRVREIPSRRVVRAAAAPRVAEKRDA